MNSNSSSIRNVYAVGAEHFFWVVPTIPIVDTSSTKQLLLAVGLGQSIAFEWYRNNFIAVSVKSTVRTCHRMTRLHCCGACTYVNLNRCYRGMCALNSRSMVANASTSGGRSYRSQKQGQGCGIHDVTDSCWDSSHLFPRVQNRNTAMQQNMHTTDSTPGCLGNHRLIRRKG